jgi:deoxycytidylate deaminase
LKYKDNLIRFYLPILYKEEDRNYKMINRRILGLALRESKKSNISIQQMGCVIFKGNQIISKGFNQVYDRNSERPKAIATIHAEMNTIENLARKHNLLKEFRRLLVATRGYCPSEVCSLKTSMKLPYRKGR